MKRDSPTPLLGRSDVGYTPQAAIQSPRMNVLHRPELSSAPEYVLRSAAQPIFGLIPDDERVWFVARPRIVDADGCALVRRGITNLHASQA